MVFFGIVRAPVNVFVKFGENDEEGDADQILQPLDVLVEINLGIHFLDLADRIEKVCQKLFHCLSPLAWFTAWFHSEGQ
jgi:hypothetical protein